MTPTTLMSCAHEPKAARRSSFTDCTSTRTSSTFQGLATALLFHNTVRIAQ